MLFTSLAVEPYGKSFRVEIREQLQITELRIQRTLNKSILNDPENPKASVLQLSDRQFTGERCSDM